MAPTPWFARLDRVVYCEALATLSSTLRMAMTLILRTTREFYSLATPAQTLRDVKDGRHTGGVNVGWADGHAKHMSTAKIGADAPNYFCPTPGAGWDPTTRNGASYKCSWQ